ncbi:MAG TPA: VanW family protein [Kofleriaceae bacterium]|jgi:vancomycin resistance protein YoaR
MSGTRVPQRGAILLGTAGGMLAISGVLAAAYYVVATRSEARAATLPTAAETAKVKTGTTALNTLLAKPVALAIGSNTAQLALQDLGVEVDPDELGRAGTVDTDADVAKLAAKGQLPLRVDRAKAEQALRLLKGRYDQAPTDAYLDLEERTIHDDAVGQGIDVFASIPRIEAAAREGAPKIELASIAVPAEVTKQGLGIDDISQVLGHYKTNYSVSDRDRDFNLKLAASKINGYVLQPHEEWSFNQHVGERSEKEGYKIAHVITAGEMVDGLAGGTCQISTTLFGAAFFGGLEIPKTTNHSRPSTYTPLGFDATVVWPDTDLVIKNPYDFPVAIHYRVANGEAVVEILGKKRPFDKVTFAREVLEETPFPSEERLKDDMPESQSMIVQPGFDGYKLTRFRRFWVGKKMVREQKWTVNYKPVTEYTNRGTSTDPSVKPLPEKEVHGPKPPSSDKFEMSQ